MTTPTPPLVARHRAWAAPVLAAALAVGLGACADAPGQGPEVATALEVTDGEVRTPAGPGATGPRLAAGPDGTPVLSWTEPLADGDALRYAAWTGSGWSPAETADAGPGRFVNWADTPGVSPLGDGRMLAHVLTDGPSSHAYDAQVRFASGGGWSEPALLNTDGKAAEHGFVSAVSLSGGRAGVVWLDGRNQAGGHHGGAMTLRYAELAADGTRRGETVLDDRTCDCCPTAAVSTPRGLVVAYRDRSPSEVRDVAVVRRVDGAWTAPTVPHPDGWQIDGCPVNGPALAARGDRVAMAWYTEADSAVVQASVSGDGGATWGPAVRVDDGRPMGQVSAAVLADGRVVVSWLEKVGDQAEVRVRALSPTPSASRAVATVLAGRSSGIPWVVALGDRALVAWTDPASSTVRTALASL